MSFIKRVKKNGPNTEPWGISGLAFWGMTATLNVIRSV